MSRRIGMALAIASAALALLVPAASAATACPDQPVEHPFGSLGDGLGYFLVPGGDFEGGAAGWTLRNAKVVSGNEPWYVGGRSDSHSLQISPGGSATSPVTCIAFDAPIMRFVTRQASGVFGALRVDAIVYLPVGTVTVPLTASAGMSGSWDVTRFIPTVVNQWAGFGQLRVSFRFSAPSTGSWLVDDVYVDPWRSR